MWTHTTKLTSLGKPGHILALLIFSSGNDIKNARLSKAKVKSEQEVLSKCIPLPLHQKIGVSDSLKPRILIQQVETTKGKRALFCLQEEITDIGTY